MPKFGTKNRLFGYLGLGFQSNILIFEISTLKFGLEGIFHILRNMPTSRAARNEHWGVRVLVGSNRKQHISNYCEEVLELRSLLLLQTGGCVWLAK